MGRQSLTTFHMTRRIIRLWFSPVRWKSKTGLSFGLISRLRLMDSAQHGYLACCHRCIGLNRIVLAYIWQVHTLIFFDCHCGWSFEVPLTSTLHTSLNWSFEIFGSSWNVLGPLEACCCRPQRNTALLREDRVKFLRTWSMVTPLAPEFGFAWVLVSGVTIARHTDSWNKPTGQLLMARSGLDRKGVEVICDGDRRVSNVPVAILRSGLVYYGQGSKSTKGACMYNRSAWQ